MEKIRVAIVGYGNIGKYAIEAVNASKDMELSGVVRRSIGDDQNPYGVKVTTDISELGKIDVAILAVPTRMVRETAEKYLNLGINTVDSYDIHSSIPDLRKELDPICQKNNAVSVIAAGWDPGSDSVVRALLEACSPCGITHTNFGPGMSMGHTVAVKAMDGVKDALSVTIPLGTGIHRRMVYVELEDEWDLKDVELQIKSDPYFIHDETHVREVDSVLEYMDKGHGTNIVRKGVSGITQNQNFEFNMRIDNPALTAQILVSCARAAMKQNAGCYTMIEIPVIDLLCGDKEDLIKRLV